MKDVLVDPLSLRSFLNFVPFLNQLERNEETQKTLGLNTNEKLERQDKKSLENAWWERKKKVWLKLQPQKNSAWCFSSVHVHIYIYNFNQTRTGNIYTHEEEEEEEEEESRTDNLFYLFHIRKQTKSKGWVVK
jgi:hypothetical protein